MCTSTHKTARGAAPHTAQRRRPLLDQTLSSQPPRSTNQPGSVKWSSVTIGSMPSARSKRHQRVALERVVVKLALPRFDAAPLDREAEHCQAEALNQRQVDALEEVPHIRRAAGADTTANRLLAVGPHAHCLPAVPVGVRNATLDLVCGCRSAKVEARRPLQQTDAAGLALGLRHQVVTKVVTVATTYNGMRLTMGSTGSRNRVQVLAHTFTMLFLYGEGT